MSLWAKATSAEGPDFAYLVSHAGKRVNNWGGSQVSPTLELVCMMALVELHTHGLSFLQGNFQLHAVKVTNMRQSISTADLQMTRTRIFMKMPQILASIALARDEVGFVVRPLCLAGWHACEVSRECDVPPLP